MAKMTKAQAATILRIWLSGNKMYYGGYTPPTWVVIHREGWVEPTGETHEYPNGQTGNVCRVTRDAVILACETLSQFTRKEVKSPASLVPAGGPTE